MGLQQTPRPNMTNNITLTKNCSTLHLMKGAVPVLCQSPEGRGVSQWGLGLNVNDVFFSVTRRSRSDESHLLTHSLSVLIDMTDVTLVSDDTYRRPY